MILYNVTKHDRRTNWCVIFSIITGRSNLTGIKLQDSDIDKVYTMIGRTFWKWWYVDHEIDKIIDYLNKIYKTNIYILKPLDWRYEGKSDRNLNKGMWGIVSLRINYEFKVDTWDGVMNSTDWTKRPATVWHCMGMIAKDDTRYLVDIFDTAKPHNVYRFDRDKWEDCKKVMTKRYYLLTK